MEHATGRPATGKVDWRDDKSAAYQALADELNALLADETDAVAALANAASLVHYALPDVN